MALPDGLYDLLLTEGLASRLELSRADVHALKEGASEFLADAITRQLVAVLDDMSGEDAYRACGCVTLETAEGDRPMSLVWKLETPLPARLFREFSVLRGL